MTPAERQKIIELVAANDRSYHLVGESFGVTRNVIAGIIFRHRHPYSVRIRSPRSLGGGGRNKIGTGYRASDYYPALTATSTR